MASDNPIVGTITCGFHPEPIQAKVKLSVKKQRLYVHCPDCGLIQPTMPNFQQHIRENATFYEEYSMYGHPKADNTQSGGEPKQEANQEQKPEAKEAAQTATPKPEEQPKVKKRGFLSALLSEDE